MTVPTGLKAGRPANSTVKPSVNYAADGIPEPPKNLKAVGKKAWVDIWTAGTWLNRTQHEMLVKTVSEQFEKLDSWAKELAFLRKMQKDRYGVELSSYEQANGSWATFPQVRLISDGEAQKVAWLRELKLSPSDLPDTGELDEATERLRKQAR